MPTRTVSTKLAIDGESEYRATLSRINTELKSMQSALKLTESEFKNNANSMAALTAKGEALSRLHDTQKAKVDALKAALENARSATQAYAEKSEEIRAKIQANNEALEKLRSTTGATTAEEEKLTKENEALNAELANNEKYLSAAEKGANNWQTQLNNAEAKLNGLDDEIAKNDKLLDEAKNSADGCADSIDEFGNEVKESGDAVEALSQALAAAGLAKTAKEIAEALRECVDAAVEFESAMAGVKRTVGGSDDFIAALGNRFKDLSTVMPITTTEMARIAETAGQLGIKQENIESFTTVMAKLATTTDLTADNAATMLAQFSNITGVTDYERLGAVVAELGDATATTASKVVDMSQGMAAAASIAGMSERDIMAIAAAVGSLGIEAQAGSTAMSTLISKLYSATERGGDELEAFASVAGMTADEFKEAWGQNAVGALDAFIKGLNDTERNGKSAIVLLDDLGIKNVRQTKAILGLSEAGDLLTRTISQANRAWEENTALNEKAGIMYGTTEAKITMYKNSVNNLKVAIGDQLTPALGDLAEKGTDATTWAQKMVEENEWLAPAVTAVATAIGVFSATLAGTVAVTKVVIPAIQALNLVMAENPYILVAAAIAAVTAALVTLALTLPSVEDEYRGLTSASKDQYDRIQELSEEYERACKLYGENSKEARELKAEIEAETAIFEQNKTTIAEVSSKTEELISRNKELRESSKESAEAIEMQRLSSDYLIGILQELMGEEEKTEGTKKQILAVVEALNKEIPTLGLAYDRYSDSLNLTQERLLALVDAEIKRRQQAADMERLIELETLQAQNEAQLVDIKEKRAAAEARLTAATAEQTAALEAYNEALPETLDAYVKATDAVADLDEEIRIYTEAEDALTAAMAENGAEIEQLTGEYDAHASAVNEAASVEEQAAQRVSGALQELARNYSEAYASALDSINGQIGIWEEMDNSAATSASKLQGAVDSQITYLQNYTANLNSLLDRNIEGIDKFAQNFTDGSAESAAALAGLAMASDEEIRNIMASMSQVDMYKETLAGLFAALETDLTGTLDSVKKDYADAVQEISKTSGDVDFSAFEDAVHQAFSEVGATFQSIGSDAAKGMSEGIDASTGEVTTAANGMGQAVIDALRTVLDSHSPSRVAEGIGEDTGEGFAEGLEKSVDRIKTAADNFGNNVTESMRRAGQESVSDFIEGFNQLSSYAESAISNLNNAAVNMASMLPGNMRNIGAQTIAGMVEGLYSGADSLYWAMESIVNSAIERARHAAATHSPSKKTEDIFENVGEGMVVGVEKKRRKVKEATQSVVDEALAIDLSGVEQVAKLLQASTPDVSGLLLPPASVAPQPTENQEISVSITVEHMEVRSEADIEDISRELGRTIKEELRRRGKV